MTTLSRLVALSTCTLAAAFAVPAGADYEGPTGYGPADTSYEHEVSHDGYAAGDPADHQEPALATEAPSYVVVEIEDGVSEKVDGETVIVVQEPEPVAATDVAPPAPRVVAVDQSVPTCQGGIWVDGYWSYANGQYIWVDGHCVVERVNYVFVHPRWDYYANVWWFVPGYYRPCGVWVGFGYYRPWHWFPPYYHTHYRGYRGVPVYRGVPRRPTVARSVARPTTRGVVPVRRIPTANRAPTRTPSVSRAPATRTGTVMRAPPSRTGTVSRVPPTRTGSVSRVPPTRTGAVTRVPPTRTGSVTRVPPNRTGAVTRVPATRSGSVTRVPPSRTSVVYRPPVGSSRTTSVARGSATRRPSTGARLGGAGSGRSGVSPSRANTVRRPSLGGSSRSRTFGGSRMTPSRSSMGARPSFGRSGGFSRPSSGGFGGARSVPTVRGR